MKNQRSNLKNNVIYFVVASLFLFQASLASAHVTVRPAEVGAAAFQTFTVGVPVEKDVPTTSIRLVIPEGLNHVTPNVKPGWTIDVKKEPFGMKGEILNTGERAPEVVTEITWSGGSIPAGQRDEFLFSAQVPAEETTIQWKAYQTYEDGTVISWDQEANADDHKNTEEKENTGPLSETKVLNDLKTTGGATHTDETLTKAAADVRLPTILSIAAIIMAGGALFMQTRKKGR